MNRRPRDAAAADAGTAFTRPIFFDTNVLVYAYEPHDAIRRQQALAVVAEAIGESRLVVSAQVMQEFYNVALRRKLLAPADALAVLRLLAEHIVVPADAASVLRAFALHQRASLSIWDALIVQSALDAGCATLFTEDLQDGQTFSADDEGGTTVTVVNPFAANRALTGHAVHEPRSTYAVTATPGKAARPRRRS